MLKHLDQCLPQTLLVWLWLFLSWEQFVVVFASKRMTKWPLIIFFNAVWETLWFYSCWNCPVIKTSPPLPPHPHPHCSHHKKNALRNVWAKSLTHALCHHHSVLLHHRSIYLVKSPSNQPTLFSSLSSISKKFFSMPLLALRFFLKSSS